MPFSLAPSLTHLVSVPFPFAFPCSQFLMWFAVDNSLCVLSLASFINCIRSCDLFMASGVVYLCKKNNPFTKYVMILTFTIPSSKKVHGYSFSVSVCLLTRFFFCFKCQHSTCIFNCRKVTMEIWLIFYVRIFFVVIEKVFPLFTKIHFI